MKRFAILVTIFLFALCLGVAVAQEKPPGPEKPAATEEPKGGPRAEISLDPDESVRLELAAQKELSAQLALELFVERVNKQIAAERARISGLSAASKQALEEVCKAKGVDPKDYQPSKDFTKLEVRQKGNAE